MVSIGDEECYTENRRGPNDMIIDAADRTWAAAEKHEDWDENSYSKDDMELWAVWQT